MTASRLLYAIRALVALELRLTLRRGESVLVTLLIPTGLLLFFASSRILPTGGRSIDFLLPGTLALAVISAGMVSLGIATAYERQYGVLKLFGVTPFPGTGVITAKVVSLMCLEAAQGAVIVAVAAIVFAWRPHGSVPLALAALVLGTCTFAGLGLAMAGAFRAEATLALTNGLFVFFLLTGGLYVPVDHLPSALQPLAKFLPAYALADALRSALRSGGAGSESSAAILLVWAVVGPMLAVRFFRWE